MANVQTSFETINSSEFYHCFGCRYSFEVVRCNPAGSFYFGIVKRSEYTTPEGEHKNTIRSVLLTANAAHECLQHFQEYLDVFNAIRGEFNHHITALTNV